MIIQKQILDQYKYTSIWLQIFKRLYHKSFANENALQKEPNKTKDAK